MKRCKCGKLVTGERSGDVIVYDQDTGELKSAICARCAVKLNPRSLKRQNKKFKDRWPMFSW